MPGVELGHASPKIEGLSGHISEVEEVLAVFTLPMIMSGSGITICRAETRDTPGLTQNQPG
jgi:hypothetical protein